MDTGTMCSGVGCSIVHCHPAELASGTDILHSAPQAQEWLSPSVGWGGKRHGSYGPITQLVGPHGISPLVVLLLPCW
jgi:hypothetical protein